MEVLVIGQGVGLTLRPVANKGASQSSPLAIPGASLAEKPILGPELLLLPSSQRRDPGRVFGEAWVWKEAGRTRALSGLDLTHHRPRKTRGMRHRSVRSEHLRDPGFWEGTETLSSVPGCCDQRQAP